MLGNRPLGVTLVAVLAWLTGAIQIVSAILGFTSNVTLSIVQLILGLITISIAFGLFRGSRVARFIMLIVFVLNITSGAYVAAVLPSNLWAAIPTIAFPLIGIILLYTGRARRFFRHAE